MAQPGMEWLIGAGSSSRRRVRAVHRGAMRARSTLRSALTPRDTLRAVHAAARARATRNQRAVLDVAGLHAAGGEGVVHRAPHVRAARSTATGPQLREQSRLAIAECPRTARASRSPRERRVAGIGEQAVVAAGRGRAAPARAVQKAPRLAQLRAAPAATNASFSFSPTRSAHGVGAPDELEQRRVAVPPGDPHTVAEPVAQQPPGLRDDDRVFAARSASCSRRSAPRRVLELDEHLVDQRHAAAALRPAAPSPAPRSRAVPCPAAARAEEQLASRRAGAAAAAAVQHDISCSAGQTSCPSQRVASRAARVASAASERRAGARGALEVLEQDQQVARIPDRDDLEVARRERARRRARRGTRRDPRRSVEPRRRDEERRRSARAAAPPR